MDPMGNKQMISYQTNNQHITVCQPFGAIIASHVPPFFHILPLRATPSVFFVALREVFSAPLVWAQTPCGGGVVVFFRTMRNHRVSHLVVGSNLNLLLRSFPKSALKMGNIRQSPSFARILGTNMYVSSCLPIHTHTYIYIYTYIYIHKTYVRHVRDLRMSTFYTRSVHPFVYPGLSIQDRSYLVLSHTHIMYIYIYVYICIHIHICSYHTIEYHPNILWYIHIYMGHNPVYTPFVHINSWDLCIFIIP